MAEPTNDIEETLKEIEEMTVKEIVQETEQEIEKVTKDEELDDKDSQKEVSTEDNSCEESMRRHQKILESLKAAIQKRENEKDEKLRNFRADPFSVIGSFKKPGKLNYIYTGK